MPRCRADLKVGRHPDAESNAATWKIPQRRMQRHAGCRMKDGGRRMPGRVKGRRSKPREDGATKLLGLKMMALRASRLSGVSSSMSQAQIPNA